MALFLLGAALWNGVSFRDAAFAPSTGILGGPASDGSAERDFRDLIAEAYGGFASIPSPVMASPSLQRDALLALGTLRGTSRPTLYKEPVRYRVLRGDTVSGIAEAHGVDERVIFAANSSLETEVLQEGAEIEIPVLPGTENLPATIASAAVDMPFDVMLASFSKGSIAFAESPRFSSGARVDTNSGDPMVVRGSFLQPAVGFNWGRLHNRNAVDIANSCGTPIVAAADGLVIDRSADTWSSGYGKYVIIEHLDGILTRYAHLSSFGSEIGDYVRQGDVIGSMGRTGEATGCHLHFEIIGAPNPFAR